MCSHLKVIDLLKPHWKPSCTEHPIAGWDDHIGIIPGIQIRAGRWKCLNIFLQISNYPNMEIVVLVQILVLSRLRKNVSGGNKPVKSNEWACARVFIFQEVMAVPKLEFWRNALVVSNKCTFKLVPKLQIFIFLTYFIGQDVFTLMLEK